VLLSSFDAIMGANPLVRTGPAVTGHAGSCRRDGSDLMPGLSGAKGKMVAA
jgi:hypothetical protein